MKTKIPETPKVRDAEIGDVYETTDPNGIVRRRAITAEDIYPGGIRKWTAGDVERRHIFFESQSPEHQDFMRKHTLIGKMLTLEQYNALMALMAPAVDVSPPADLKPLDEKTPPAE